MADSKAMTLNELKALASEIIQLFTSNDEEYNVKWSLLETYHSAFFQRNSNEETAIASYAAVLSALVDALKPTLFREKSQEVLFDKLFLQGIPHHSFIILARDLDRSADYGLLKRIELLRKFVQGSLMDALFVRQCYSSKSWDLKYVSKSAVWDRLITMVISLPERIANRMQGKFIKVFRPACYVPLLLSSVFRALDDVHRKLRNSEDCTVEFLAKLVGRLCVMGNGDVVAQRFSKHAVYVCGSDYIWRRMFPNFVCKMPAESVDPFITHLLLQIPWYGYVELILGDEGVKNERIHYFMTVKLLFFRQYTQVIILQNIIGYFAMSPSRVLHFEKILDSLLASWQDEKALKNQGMDQKMYIASALLVCAGWLERLKLKVNEHSYICKVLKGVQLRLGSSEVDVCSLGMIVGEQMLKVLDPDSEPIQFEHTNEDLLYQLEGLVEIPSEPDEPFTSSEDLWCFEETPSQSSSEKEIEPPSASANEQEIDSEDDLEAYDLSNDVPQSQYRRPLYLRDCMMGMLEEKDVEWKEQCMRHAEKLIKENPYATEEIAEEMAKIALHLEDEGSIPDFKALRRSILIGLTVQCPLTVSSYLQSQFIEREYTIRQRLDILEVLSVSSMVLSSLDKSLTSPEAERYKAEAEWQIIIHHRLQAKTKYRTKAQAFPENENKFSAIARNFFHPLLNAYEKASRVLDFQDRDSYVLGRFIYTLGIIMCSAANTLHCGEMGAALFQFLAHVRPHRDVFVRQSSIFATAAALISVPPSLLFTDMLEDVTDFAKWLQLVAENDADRSSIEKSLYALSIYQSAAKERSLLCQLQSLSVS